MKKQIVNIVLAAFIIVGALSCKEKDNKEELSEVKETVSTEMATATFNVNTEKSVIHWKGSKPTKTHTGTLKLGSGTLEAAGKDIQNGTFVIDMNSLTDTDLEGDSKANLEAHLKGTVEGKEKDFFNVTQYPTAKFEMTEVTGEGGNIMVKGNLTIKDITKPVEFPAVVSFPGDDIFLKSKSFTIDRTQWEVNFLSKSVFDNLKDKFIDDDVELTIELHGSKA